MSDNPMLRYAFAHEQTARTARYYVMNRYKRHQRARRVTEALPFMPTVAQVADADRLISIFYELKLQAGQAPGPDGFTYTDWSRREVADILRELSKAMCAGTYRPGPIKSISVCAKRVSRRKMKV